jgi:Fic family protein
VGVVFETASRFETPRLMAGLVDWFDQAQQGELHPLIAIGIFVVVFLEIHPFQDGNGRLSRVLTTLLLLRAGYAYVPCSSLESVIEQSKEGYYLALRGTQATIRTDTPDWAPWLTFFLKALQRQMRRLRKAIERERLLLAKLPDLAIQILDHARDHGRITTTESTSPIELLVGVRRSIPSFVTQGDELQNTPLKRLGEPVDMTNAALFLCSPAASWVSGQILTVSSGGVQELD